MPAYEFRCNSCSRRVILRYKTIAEYEAARHTCPHCGGTDLTRLIGRVAIARSPLSRLMGGGSDDDMGDDVLDDLDNADPRTLGRMLREMSAEVGEDIGPEFDEVVTRLERGEDPESIEASLPELSDMPGDSPGGAPESPSLGGDDF